MSEKKKSSKTSKFKNFLVTGSIEEEGEDHIPADEEMLDNEYQQYEQDDEDCYSDDPVVEEEVFVEDIVRPSEVSEPETDENSSEPGYVFEDQTALMEEIAELKAMVSSLTSQLERCTTSKEQLKEYSALMNKRDSELANRKFMGMLEQLSAMREDFFKLCNGVNAKLDSFTPKSILNSFEAYGVDMENILLDCGVFIGQFQYEKLNTIHQRIVDVIPTDDETLNGMVAERVSDGYEYNGRVLLKEKVKIYKFSEKKEETEGDEEK